jgi:hypothetical protein
MYIRKREGTSPEKRVLAWIRKRIHPYCWGRSDRFKDNFTGATKSQILDFFGCLRFGLPKRFLPSLKNRDFMAHVTGQIILYFQADGRCRVPEVLVKIDIDCHSKGSFQGAVECVEWLKNNGFPGLFWSRSTNGRGIHAYLVVRKRLLRDVEVDRALLSLERWLQYQHHVLGWDVEKIEVKGRPPIYEWGGDKYELNNVKMGSLAKVPVEAIDRPEELMATATMSTARLNRLRLEVPRDWKQTDNICSTYSLPISNDGFDEIDYEEFRLWQPESGNRIWCHWIERMARAGLVEDDSMGKVVFELAKWLLHVELFDKDDRQAVTTELLKMYVIKKHNGHVTRLNQGSESEVLSQIERVVASALKVSQDSRELFERIRQKRGEGKYHRVIRIAPLLCGSRATISMDTTDIICTTYSLPIREDLLPPTLEQKLHQYAELRRMRRTQGEFPFVRFSRRMLNALYDKKGSARLSTALLTSWVSNVHQQNDFKVALRSLNLLRDWTGTYRAKSVSCLYRLTEEAKLLLRH